MRVATLPAYAHVHEATITPTDVLDRARAVLNHPDTSTDVLHGALADLAAAAERLLSELDAERHCPLTGLWTRRPWTQQAQQLIEAGPTALLLLDLDGFKPINDGFGHAAGDAVLAEVARRLHNWCSSYGGAAGRLGGDEFVAAVPAHPWLREQIDMLRVLLAAPVQHGARELTVGVSIGWTVAGQGEDLSTALGRADQAMYRKKRQRHGGTVRGRRGRPVIPGAAHRPVAAPRPLVVGGVPAAAVAG